MRFMMLMIPKAYERADSGAMPAAEAVKRMMNYNESLRQAGVLIALEGLHPPSTGSRVVFSAGKPKPVEPPFPGVTEALGGYWMIDVGTLDEAVAWASRCPAFEGDIVEVRPVQEFGEFPADVQAAIAEFPEMRTEFGQSPSGAGSRGGT